jgi:hypothetical protein
MASKRVYGVLFTEAGLEQLEPALKVYLSEGPIGKYLYCKEANPDRNYFYFVVERTNSDGSTFEAEFFVPHHFIKLVMAGTERKHIGFVWPSECA